MPIAESSLRLLLPTICPAPTTPNCFTSAAAATLELVLSERRLALLARLANCRPARRVVDMFRYQEGLVNVHASTAMNLNVNGRVRKNFGTARCTT